MSASEKLSPHTSKDAGVASSSSSTTATPVVPLSDPDNHEAAHQSGQHGDKHVHPLANLTSTRKHILLLIFSIAMFVDVCNISGVAVAVAQIAIDIKLQTSQTVWILTAYSLTFASFLLFAGRLSDLFPAQVVFEAGFILLGIISLVTSFVTHNKYGFLVLRGIGGITGALTIPSAYHLAVHMFPDPLEKQKKLAILGLASAAGNVLGLVLAGLTMLASYHWFFRLMAIICLLFGGMTVLLLPYTPSTWVADGVPRWRRLDFVGVLLMSGALLCFILALTQGPIDGWSSASFIAPIILAFLLAPAFFFWEARISPKSAVLPATVWKIKNMILASAVMLMPFSFWATNQLLYATYWQWIMHWKPLHVAAAMLPQGIASLIVGGISQRVPVIITKPKMSVPFGSALMVASELLMYFSDGGHGLDYWRYCFPAFIIGSIGALLVYMGSGINLITYCPPEMGGVAGAWAQVVGQVGGAIALGIQAGLEGKDLTNWRYNARGFWYMLAGVAVSGIAYVLFYDEPMSPEDEHEKTRARIREVEARFGLQPETAEKPTTA